MNDLTRLEKMAEAADRGEYKITDMKKTEGEVIFICELNTKMTAVHAYLAGERLAAMRAAKEYGEFTSWLKEKFQYSRVTAYRYIGLYNVFNGSFIRFESPDQNKRLTARLLEYPSLNAALTAAGIIKGKKEEQENDNTYGDGETYVDLGGGSEMEIRGVYADMFRQPSASGLPLKNHRTSLDLYSNGLVMARRLDGGHIVGRTVVYLEVRGSTEETSGDPCLQIAYNDMACEIQAAVEKYLLSVEQYDDSRGEKQLYDSRAEKKKETARKNQERKDLEREIKWK